MGRVDTDKLLKVCQDCCLSDWCARIASVSSALSWMAASPGGQRTRHCAAHFASDPSNKGWVPVCNVVVGRFRDGDAADLLAPVASYVDKGFSLFFCFSIQRERA